MNIYDEKIADRIRECAKKVGSGNELTRLTGIKRRTLEDYMTGISEPKASALYAIAKAAGVSLDWLIAGEGEEEKTPAIMNPEAVDLDLLSAIITLVDSELGSFKPETKGLLCTKIYAYIMKKRASGQKSDESAEIIDFIEVLKSAG